MIEVISAVILKCLSWRRVNTLKTAMLWSHLSNLTFRDSKMNFCKDKVRQETLKYCQCRTEFSWQAHLNDFSYFPPDRRPTTNDFHQWGSGAHLQQGSARVTLLQPGWWAISSKGQQLSFPLSFPLDPPQHTGKSGRLPGTKPRLPESAVSRISVWLKGWSPDSTVIISMS